MSYEFLILAFLLLVFCLFTITFVINVIISLVNALEKDEIGEIKPIHIIKKPEKKRKKSDMELYYEEQERKTREQYKTIMENIEAYDGTDMGQKEVK